MAFLINGTEKTNYHTWKTESRPLSLPCTKIKIDKDLNFKTEKLNLLEHKRGKTFEVTWIGKGFLNRTSAAQIIELMINIWVYIKLKSFFISEEITNTKKTTNKTKKIFGT